MLLDVVRLLAAGSSRSTYDHVVRAGDGSSERSARSQADGSRYIAKIIGTQMIVLSLNWLLPARRLIIVRHGHRVQYVHAHRALLLDYEPLVNAVIVEVVIAWLQDFYELLIRYHVEANGAVVDLHLRCLPCEGQ